MNDLTVTHIGGPTVLLEIGGWRLLTDPTFDPPGQRYGFGWGTSSHKLVGPAIAAEDIGPIDAVLLSHDQHGDNLDHLGRTLLPDAGEVLTSRAGANRLGGNARGLKPWQTHKLDEPTRKPITVTATPARHGPPLSRALSGSVIGFLLSWDGQDGAVWITGDTVLHSRLREVPQRHRIGTIIIHLGCVRFPITGPARYTMDAAAAIELCRQVGARTVIPVHYDGWQHFGQEPAAASAAFAAAPQSIQRSVQWLLVGAPTTVTT